MKHLVQTPVGLRRRHGDIPNPAVPRGAAREVVARGHSGTHQFCSLRSHGPEPMCFRKSAACRTSLCVNHEQPESSSAVHRREANVMDLDLPPDAPYSKFQKIWGWMCDPHLAVCHKVKIVPLWVRVFLRGAFLDLSSDAAAHIKTLSKKNHKST